MAESVVKLIAAGVRPPEISESVSVPFVPVMFSAAKVKLLVILANVLSVLYFHAWLFDKIQNLII